MTGDRAREQENLRHAVMALKDAQARVGERAKFQNAYTNLSDIPWEVQVALSALRDAQEHVVEAAVAFVEATDA